MITAQDNHQIYPPYGEDLAAVPIEDDPASAHHRLQFVQELRAQSIQPKFQNLNHARLRGSGSERPFTHLVVVDDIALPFFVPTFVAFVLLYEIADVDVT